VEETAKKAAELGESEFHFSDEDGWLEKGHLSDYREFFWSTNLRHL
jgi:hypothetical protein